MKKFYFLILGVLALGGFSSLAYFTFTTPSSPDADSLVELPPAVHPLEILSIPSIDSSNQITIQSAFTALQANVATMMGISLRDGISRLSYTNLMSAEILQQLAWVLQPTLHPDSSLSWAIPPIKPGNSVTNHSAALLHIQIPPSKPVNQTARNPVSTSLKPNPTASSVKPNTAISSVRPNPLASDNAAVFQAPATNTDPQYHGKVRVSMIPYTGAAFATSGVVWEVYQNDPATKTVSTKIFMRSALAQFEFSLPEGNYVVRARYNNMTADLLVPVQAKHVYQYILNFYAGQTRLVADFANHSGSTEPVSWEIRPRSDASRIIASGSGHDSLVPLREGNYLVFAKSGSFHNQTPLEIRAGQTKQVNVTLQASN